jgi:ABC-2 type transport system permease protein
MQINPISISVENLTRTYKSKGKNRPPVVANDNLSFEVKRGEIFGLLGPNGAGKTTLVSQLLGLQQPTTGNIWVEGINVTKHPEKVKRIMGYLPQTGMPMRYLEVERALHYTGRLRGQSEHDAKQQTHELLKVLDLDKYSKRYVNNLSGGLLRLTNFAMSLMGRPQVLILDEPTNELDPHKRRIVWDMVAELNQQQGVTTILVTHNVLEAERVIQRVAVMQRGQIVALGTPGELKLQNGGKVRLEFQLKDTDELSEYDFSKLNLIGELEEPRSGFYRLYLDQPQVAAATDFVVNQIGLTRLDDFRLAPPSLEDIYLELEELQDNGKELVA